MKLRDCRALHYYLGFLLNIIIGLNLSNPTAQAGCLQKYAEAQPPYSGHFTCGIAWNKQFFCGCTTRKDVICPDNDFGPIIGLLAEVARGRPAKHFEAFYTNFLRNKKVIPRTSLQGELFNYLLERERSQYFCREKTLFSYYGILLDSFFYLGVPLTDAQRAALANTNLPSELYRPYFPTQEQSEAATAPTLADSDTDIESISLLIDN